MPHIFFPDRPDGLQEVPVQDTNIVSDGYHTFGELYEHRMVLYMALVAHHPAWAFKTRQDHEGNTIEGWFILGMNTPFGQVSYHLPDRFWDEVDVREVDRNRRYDGHKGNDVLERIRAITDRISDRVRPVRRESEDRGNE